MRLAALHRPKLSLLAILEALVRLYAPQLGGREALPILTEITKGEVAWPADWAMALFQPPRNFEARKQARRFLNWLVKLGVPAQPWLDYLEEPQGHEAVPPPRPWEGYVGRAYPIGDYVVKFTTDKNEAGLAAAIQGQDSPHLATVYGVTRAGGGQTLSGASKELYAIVQQRLNTGVGRLFRQAGSAVYNYLDRFNVPIKDAEQTADVISRDYAKGGRGGGRGGGDARLHWAIRAVVRAVKDIYDRFHLMYLDPHGANLAFKGRELAFFDLGRSTGRHGPVGSLW